MSISMSQYQSPDTISIVSIVGYRFPYHDHDIDIAISISLLQ